MNKDDEQYNFTIVIIGEKGVGKTSILYKYVKKDKFIQTTISNQFEFKNTTLDGKKVKITFIDTSGQEQFLTITKSVFHQANGFIIVFDLNNEISFDNILYWFYQIKNTVDIKDTEILMIGNKNDLERKVSLERIHNFEKMNKLEVDYIFHETSAKTGDGIEESLQILIEKLIKHYEINKKNNKIKPKNIKIDKNSNHNIKENKKENKSSCC